MRAAGPQGRAPARARPRCAHGPRRDPAGQRV